MVVGNSSSRSWGKSGENGGDVKMSLTDQTVEGDIVVDEISTLDLDISGSVLTGAINADSHTIHGPRTESTTRPLPYPNISDNPGDGAGERHGKR